MHHHLRVYLSIGVTHLGGHFRSGVELDVNMTIFDTRSRMHVEVSRASKLAAFKEMIEPFTLCEIRFCGAHNSDDHLEVDLTLSDKQQKIFISGRVTLCQSSFLAVPTRRISS